MTLLELGRTGGIGYRRQNSGVRVRTYKWGIDKGVDLNGIQALLS